MDIHQKMRDCMNKYSEFKDKIEVIEKEWDKADYTD